MAKPKSDNPSFRPTPATRQLAFHQLLVAARKTVLTDALAEALQSADPEEIHAEIVANVPKEIRKILAAGGVRDEHVFPTTRVLEIKPTLIGYYRLLLGAPQKSFYGPSTGLSLFKTAESSGILNEGQQQLLPAFCKAMSLVLSDLARQISPRITPRDISELPLLTLGSQFQGANNNLIGKQAVDKVFLAIALLVKPFVTQKTANTISLQNAAGRAVVIHLAADPDLRITELIGKTKRNKVAIEVKGGSDRSNAHNRAGEAEKSHQKARAQKFTQFWTLMAKQGLALDKLKQESPTTTEWFDISHILAAEGDDWLNFRSHLATEIGIPLT